MFWKRSKEQQQDRLIRRMASVADFNDWRTYNSDAVIDLSGRDLSKMNLSGIDLTEACLAGTNLSNTILNAADLTDADLSDAEMTHCKLKGARLHAANLTGCTLIWADLTGADLYQANLSESDLEGSVFDGANFDYCNLRDAILRSTGMNGAQLSEAKLDGAILGWQSHDLIAEILRRHAGENLDRLMVAGLVLLQRDWCWEKFLTVPHAERDWALEVLAGYARKGDAHPSILDRFTAGQSHAAAGNL